MTAEPGFVTLGNGLVAFRLPKPHEFKFDPWPGTRGEALIIPLLPGEHTFQVRAHEKPSCFATGPACFACDEARRPLAEVQTAISAAGLDLNLEPIIGEPISAN